MSSGHEQHHPAVHMGRRAEWLLHWVGDRYGLEVGRVFAVIGMTARFM